MASFVVLTLGFLLGMGILCRAVWRGITRDSWAYDREFLWKQYELTRAEPPNAG